MATTLDSEPDPASALLIAHLQLEDTLQISLGRKGKARASAPPTDEEIAFQLQEAELGAFKQVYEDFTLAQSLHDALDRDAPLLEAYRVMEDAAAADRRVAEMVARGEPVPRPTDAQRRVERREFSLERAERSSTTPKPRKRVPVGLKPAPQLGEEEPLDSIWRFDDVSESLPKAGPSVDHFKRVDCVGCDTKLRLTDALSTACNHHWCTGCIESLAQVYLRDETLHPLRCCKNPFPLPSISAKLNGKRLLAQYLAKKAEYDVSAQNRVYCSTPTCSAFLGSKEGRGGGHPRDTDIPCTKCHSHTCALCRGASHAGTRCGENEAVNQVRSLARESGWQTCPGCFTVVDLHHGCNHMTCTCKTEFCFVCGVRWKNCPCEQWDEGRLMDTARMRAGHMRELPVWGRAAGAAAAGGAAAAQRVQEPMAMFEAEVARVAENIRVNHGCELHSWKGTGAGTCEECGDYMHVFLKVRLSSLVWRSLLTRSSLDV
uniref:RBR-type E3 ubiquitin transferase n=1 Tax=Coprinellus disseminatus TaxID=71703 RepID=Q1WMV1_COPDI|nr:conserved hypothetical protein [Coprinellus disseminatus]